MAVKLKEVGEYIDEVLKPVMIEPLIVTETKSEPQPENIYCELCKLVAGDKRTKQYYENDNWIICECKTCHRPMIVYKHHTMFIPFTDWFAIYTKVMSLFGSQITLRFKQRKIYDHFHVHIYRDEEKLKNEIQM